MRSMRPEEIEGVLAHEVAHIANGDMVTMTLLQGVINAFVMFFARLVAYAVRTSSDSRSSYALSFMVMIVLEIVLGILGSLITAWFSRQREFRADYGGATLAGQAADARRAAAAGRQPRSGGHLAPGAGDAEDQRRARLDGVLLDAPAARAAHRRTRARADLTRRPRSTVYGLRSAVYGGNQLVPTGDRRPETGDCHARLGINTKSRSASMSLGLT